MRLFLFELIVFQYENNKRNRTNVTMDEQKNCIFVARKEFTTYLVYVLYPPIYQGIKSIWEDAKRTAAKPRDVYPVFQNKLARVRKWNQDVIEAEYKRVIDKTECYYLEELIKRVFVLNTQILAAVNMTHIDPNKKIKVKVPKGEKFLHHCYRECARAFFENAILMEDRPNTLSRVEQLKNLQKSYKLIMTCIENTIRNMLPIESLLKNSMDEEGEGEEINPAAVFSSPANPSSSISQPFATSPFPTINNFLQQQGGTPVIQAPSNGSLQPSMTDLGTIPIPAETGGLQKPTFDPNSLFEPKKEDNDNNDNNDNNKPEQNEDAPPSTSPFPKPFSLGSFNPFKVSEQPTPKDSNLKTIFFGSKPLDRKRSESHRDDGGYDERRDELTDGSEGDVPRSKRDIGGEELEDSQGIPVVRHGKVKENLDLDVNSSDNELPLQPSPFENSTVDLESSKQTVPPIEHLEKENFFSDVE